MSRLNSIFKKAEARYKKENNKTTTQVNPHETDAERTKRIILARIEQQKREAQESGGRSVRY